MVQGVYHEFQLTRFRCAIELAMRTVTLMTKHKFLSDMMLFLYSAVEKWQSERIGRLGGRELNMVSGVSAIGL